MPVPLEGAACYHDKEGHASLLFFVSLVLVLVVGLCSLVLLLVKDGLVQVVKGCCRRQDGGRKGTLAAG